MDKILCIGGPLAGQMVPERGKRFECAIRQPIPDVEAYSMDATETAVMQPPRFTYRREVFSWYGKARDLYVPDGLNSTDFLDFLLDEYRRVAPHHDKEGE